MDAAKPYPETSLLGLPVELRIHIFERLFSQGQDETSNYVPELVFRGFNSRNSTTSDNSRLPFVLLLVCRQLYHEVRPAIPPMSRIQLVLVGFSPMDMESWLSRLTDDQVDHIRRIIIKGDGKCRFQDGILGAPDEHAAKVITCARSICIDLTSFECHVDKEAFTDAVEEPLLRRYRSEAVDYNKMVYLERRGYVRVGPPEAGNHVGIACSRDQWPMYALGTLVSDCGEVQVTKESLKNVVWALGIEDKDSLICST